MKHTFRSLSQSVMPCAAMFLTMATHVHSAVLVSNLSGTDNASASPQSTFWLAQAFTTDDSSYTLESITIQGSNSSGGSQVFIYSDNASLPSISLGSVSTASFGTSSGTYVLPVQGSVTLDASQTYWVVFAPNDVNFGLWARTTASGNLDGPGTIPDLQAFSTNGGASFTSTDITNYLKFEINAVPEPATAMVASLGLLLVGRRRRNS